MKATKRDLLWVVLVALLLTASRLAPQERTRYEVTFTSSSSLVEMERQLNDWGDRGWQLVGCFRKSDISEVTCYQQRVK